MIIEKANWTKCLMAVFGGVLILGILSTNTLAAEDFNSSRSNLSNAVEGSPDVTPAARKASQESPPKPQKTNCGTCLETCTGRCVKNSSGVCFCYEEQPPMRH